MQRPMQNQTQTHWKSPLERRESKQANRAVSAH